jgi:HEAT repeat protein
VGRPGLGGVGVLGGGKVPVRERLEALLDEDDPVVTPGVTDALVRLRDPEVAGALSRSASLSHDGRVRRAAREALRAVRERSPGDEARKVRDEVDRVRDELRALRDEVAKLRASAPKPAPPKPRAAKARAVKPAPRARPAKTRTKRR